MPGVLNKCHLRLYADDSILMFSHKEIDTLNKVLNEEFSDVCDWFVSNRLSIHLDEKKTKCILFSRQKNVCDNFELKIVRGNFSVKQYDTVDYLGCLLDSRMSGELMAKKMSIKNK